MAYNKVVYGGNTLIDLTGDDITAADLLAGKTAHGADGEALTGTMTNRGAVSGTIATKAGKYTVPAGYHNGSGTVGISATEQAKIIATNIKSGVSILGVTGSYSGDGISLQTKSATYTPATTSQSATVTADANYDGLASVAVTVNAIPYVEEDNSAGGKTVTIG